jgi:transposase-like protein
MRKKYTAEQRAKLIEEVRAGGARVSEVAKRLGVSSSAAYLWVKEAAPAPAAPTFAKLVRAQAKPANEMVLEVGTVKLRVGDDFDAALLRRVVAALSGAT